MSWQCHPLQIGHDSFQKSTDHGQYLTTLKTTTEIGQKQPI